VHPLRQHFLAGTAFAADQHGRIDHRIAPRQRTQIAHRRRIARQVVQAVTHARRPGARARAQVAVRAVNRVGVLDRQHGACRAGLAHDRNPVDDHHLVAQPMDCLELARAALHHAVEGQSGRQRG
jgi:hypothetical protein